MCVIIFFNIFRLNLLIFQTEITSPLLQVVSSNANIEFNSVNFQYVEGRKILKDLSFNVPAGNKIAIVGGSGSG